MRSSRFHFRSSSHPPLTALGQLSTVPNMVLSPSSPSLFFEDLCLEQLLDSFNYVVPHLDCLFSDLFGTQSVFEYYSLFMIYTFSLRCHKSLMSNMIIVV